MKMCQFYDSPTALFCEFDAPAQSKTISGRPSGIAAAFCGGQFRSHRPQYYENVLILRQSHDLVLRIRRAGAVKTTISDVKIKRCRKIERHPKMSVCIKNGRFRSHRPSFHENTSILRQSPRPCFANVTRWRNQNNDCRCQRSHNN